MRSLPTRLLLLGAALLLPACNGLPDDLFGFTFDAGPDEADAGPPPLADLAPRETGPPPPVSGGTLAVGERVFIVADPDRDRVLLVDRFTRDVRVALNDLPEPGRVLLDGRGQVHVLLRGSGEVLSFDLDRPDHPVRTPVCGAPRGLVEGPAGLIVACASGGLYAVDPDEGTATLLGRPATDLRDLVRVRDRLFASRFRAAEVLELDDSGRLGRRIQLRLPQGTDGARAAVAWRMVATDDGRLAIAHQVAHPERPNNQDDPQPAYGGGGGGCGPLVVGAVTLLHPDDQAPVAQPLDGAALPVDVAVGPGGQVALAAASGLGEASARALLAGAPSGCMATEGRPLPPARYTAVARTATGFVYQARNPAALEIVEDDGQRWSVPLGGGSVADDSLALFHDATRAGLACASCHPEGEDDGITWHFQTEGRVRTPSLRGGLVAPFHWRGELPSLSALLSEVMTRRMEGPAVSAERVAALSTWLDGLPTLDVELQDTEAVARGADVFAAAGCSGCHLDGGGADGLGHDVGTGGVFQTPTLWGAGRRLPLMHDGCAATLADRFRPACGGANHGATADLAPRDQADLVAYLKSL